MPYLVEGGVVREAAALHTPQIVTACKDWRNCKPGRMVYTKSKGLWYIMSAGGFWNALPKKPDVISMAELIGAIAKVTVKEIKDEISSDSFFQNQRSRT
ncbi:hypothetical protein [Pseudomonas phage 98PfluR60PP]|uniref:Uncharacterized protein n=1 Tax=Pseudomonas phage 98PfluR60PP TaxID=2163965 RepID=A0A2S1PG27_9CAUD|nr:hypothetical protein PP760_gp85 [Pseudomonas phage 98PfluR60PP]AWH15517.1 hypothetical protein [Pseudomonas phage 98PfluR60PP]